MPDRKLSQPIKIAKNHATKTADVMDAASELYPPDDSFGGALASTASYLRAAVEGQPAQACVRVRMLRSCQDLVLLAIEDLEGDSDPHVKDVVAALRVAQSKLNAAIVDFDKCTL